MLVRCLREKSAVSEALYAVTVGKEYRVLSIEFYDPSKSVFINSVGDFCLYRIRDDENIILLVPANLFEIVSGKIPPNWVCFGQTDGSFEFLPEPWARKFFWDDYYNDEKTALDDVRKIEDEMQGI